MIFHKDGKVAEFYYGESGYWRVKTNCPGLWKDFEMVRFTKFHPNNVGLPDDWFNFLQNCTADFRILMNPFGRNAEYGNGKSLCD